MVENAAVLLIGTLMPAIPIGFGIGFGVWHDKRLIKKLLLSMILMLAAWVYITLAVIMIGA